MFLNKFFYKKVSVVNKDLYILPLDIIIKMVLEKKMGKKIGIILIIILFFSLLIPGCLEENKSNQQERSIPNNSAPVPIINAPVIAYFGDSISFDASSSYDSDGKIIFYEWDFGDGEIANGVKVDHTYNFENDFKIEYPLIFSIILAVSDNDGSWEPIIHQISLYPKTYSFYLDSGSLLIEKPSSNEDLIKASFGKLKIIAIQELHYDLSEFIEIYPCTWNATIYLEKPRLAIINGVSLALYNDAGEIIAEGESNFKLLDFWDKKTIKLCGKIDKSKEFKSIKLIVYGFCLREKIQILYGSEKASRIVFDFTI